MSARRFLLLTIGTAGDVFPFVGVGRELARRGHDVLLASLESYRRPVLAAGLPFRPVEGIKGAAGHPDFYHPTKGMEVVASTVLLPALHPVFELAQEAASEGRTIVADPFCYGARVAQELSGFRAITAIVSPFLIRSTDRMPVTPGIAPPPWAPKVLKRAFFAFVAWLWDRRLGPELNRFRSAQGLPPVRDVFYGWSLSPDRVLGLFPDWFAPRGADWPPQFVHGGFTVYDGGEAEDVPPALAALDRPLVVFAAGSAGTAAASFFSAAVEASRGRGWHAALLGGKGQLPAAAPANVSCWSYVPLSRLLPLASAVVYHGGLGTMSLAMRCGTPQVIAPFGHDQFDNAARAERLGVARVISAKPSGLRDRMAAAVEAALGDEALRSTALRLAPRADLGAALTAAADEIERAPA